MKHSIISWVLGASLMIAAPAAMADNNWKSNKHENKYNKHHAEKQYKRENKHKKRRWAKNWNNRPSDYNNHNYYATQRIYDRQDRQARRINRGINKGQLVDREIRNLRKEQRRIAKRLRRFQYDGYLNRHETRKINQMLDVASNNIRNKRHNRLTRASEYNRYPYGYPQDSQYEFVFNW